MQMRHKVNKIQLLIYFLIIFIFTFLPYIGLVYDSIIWIKYDIQGMAYANGCFLIILYTGVFLAFKKIQHKNYGWCENYKIEYVTVYLKRVFKLTLIFAAIQFILRGHSIFSGIDRGDVRTSMGIWGPLSTFIGLYGIPTLLSIATVLYCFFSRKTKIENNYYKYILITSLFVGLMAGGKANLVTMAFPAIIQGASKLNIKKIGIIGIFGAFSIILIGTKQMNMSYTESLNYNIYRSTALASFGTVGVWQECKKPSNNAPYSLFCGLGENTISLITGVPKHSPEFLKYILPRDITYKYYANQDVALTGKTNLTITAFGESVFWGGHDYYFIFAIIFSMAFYIVTILIFKTRCYNKIKLNILYTTFFTAVCIPWLNSTLGSFIGQWFGLATILYMFLTWLLINRVFRPYYKNKCNNF